jgi:hypothetical protein
VKKSAWAPTPLKTPHLQRNLKIQEPECGRRKALCANPYSDSWILDSWKIRGPMVAKGVFIIFGGLAGPWKLPYRRGSATE